MTTLEVFPLTLRSPGPYFSQDVAQPIEASVMRVTITGREASTPLGLTNAMLTLGVERNVDGVWRFVASTDVIHGAVLDDDGQLTDEAYLALTLAPVGIPVPYYRVFLRCYSPCLSQGTLTFT